MTNPTVAVSAPGKVLLAGGYLVLDRAYTGLVFALSARINVVAQEIHTGPGVQLSEVVVESPQFVGAQWRYGYHLADNDGGVKVTQLQIGSHINPNPFVETTLSYVLTYISRTRHNGRSRSIKPCRLTILADNDYYSQPPTEPGPDVTTTTTTTNTSSSSSSETPVPPRHASRFAAFPVALTEAHKTGLGSSAALVTALTAALLAHHLHPSSSATGPTSATDPSSPSAPLPFSSPRGRRILHNLAQAAHCAAQGKIGSGFDVAAAVYGSCRYRRFRPDVLAGLGEPGRPGFTERLAHVVDDDDDDDGKRRWDVEIDPDAASLPSGVAIRMCDVDCGSQTVGMVKKVLAWRQAAGPAAQHLWDELQARNKALAAALKKQQQASSDEITQRVAAVRELVRRMGAESRVPIEPESQTELLDALTERVDGVLGGVVPGAGGFDALALLVRDDADTEARVEAFLERWAREKGVRVRLLAVKGEMEGARAESLDTFDGWLRET